MLKGCRGWWVGPVVWVEWSMTLGRVDGEMERGGLSAEGEEGWPHIDRLRRFAEGGGDGSGIGTTECLLLGRSSSM